MNIGEKSLRGELNISALRTTYRVPPLLARAFLSGKAGLSRFAVGAHVKRMLRSFYRLGILSGAMLHLGEIQISHGVGPP